MGFELDRTRSNSIKLVHGEKNVTNPMNYEESSKSIELDRTVTPNLLEVGLWQNGGDDS